MKGQSMKYKYVTKLKWTGEKKGIQSCENKPDIAVACPPEFGGHDGFWTPEDFFVASIEVCTMTTFLWFIKKERIELKSYSSQAEGIAELVENTFQFSTIAVNMKIGISKKDDKIKIEKIIKKIPSICLVSKSTKCEVILKTEILYE